MTDITHDILVVNQAADAILKHKVDGLQVIPAVALKLLRLTQNEKTNVVDLSKLIETEPTLAAKVLRNVNSAAFALSHKVTSIKRAVSILGFSSVRQLALNQLFYNKLINHQARKEFDQLFYWQHCLFVASLSRAIATALKHEDPDLIYCAGLMHDIGKIVLETHGKVSYSDFLLACKDDEQTTLKGEHDFFGLNHAEMGFVFCQQWDIPEQISAIVYCHHDLPVEGSIYDKYKQDISIVNFSNYIAWMQGIGSTKVNNPPELHADTSKNLNIASLNLEKLLGHVDQEMQNTREFYGIQFPNVNQLRATLIETALLLSYSNKPLKDIDNSKNQSPFTSLTVPHKSLNPDKIVPWTLAAIQADFNFDRIVFFQVNAKQRSLEATHCHPESMERHIIQNQSIKIESLPKAILKSLRERTAVVINVNEDNTNILDIFDVKEYLVLPVLSQNRLIALLYMDNAQSSQPITLNNVSQITPIVHELGVALNNAKRYQMEKKRAEMDSLTGLMNKRMVIEYLTETFAESSEQLNHVAVGFIDIDFFKKFNDSCGHEAGDDALKIVAQIMQTLTRPNDFIGRYGGEEFVFVLNGTSAKGAYCYAERIRQEIERKGKILKQRFHGHSLTISVGVSLYNSKYKTYNQIIEAADSAMYTAKQQGRNCVVVV